MSIKHWIEYISLKIEYCNDWIESSTNWSPMFRIELLWCANGTSAGDNVVSEQWTRDNVSRTARSSFSLWFSVCLHYIFIDRFSSVNRNSRVNSKCWTQYGIHFAYLTNRKHFPLNLQKCSCIWNAWRYNTVIKCIFIFKSFANIWIISAWSKCTWSSHSKQSNYSNGYIFNLKYAYRIMCCF